MRVEFDVNLHPALLEVLLIEGSHAQLADLVLLVEHERVGLAGSTEAGAATKGCLESMSMFFKVIGIFEH